MRTQLSVVILLVTCATQTSEVPLEKDFELRQGQTVRIGGTGHTVTLEAVPEDSRCPANVQCVWAGNARVALRVGDSGRDTTIFLNTGIAPGDAGIGKIRLELKAVTPEPQAGAATPAGTYRVTLRATAL